MHDEPHSGGAIQADRYPSKMIALDVPAPVQLLLDAFGKVCVGDGDHWDEPSPTSKLSCCSVSELDRFAFPRLKHGAAVWPQRNFPQLAPTNGANPVTWRFIRQPTQLDPANAEIVSFASSRSVLSNPLLSAHRQRQLAPGRFGSGTSRHPEWRRDLSANSAHSPAARHCSARRCHKVLTSRCE
jgi:hypothetical protein